MSKLRLVPILLDGNHEHPEYSSEHVKEVCGMMSRQYSKTGFYKPWIGYLAVVDSNYVGTCAFKSIPIDQRVEIAYYTFPHFEKRGFATQMARELISMAKREKPEVLIFAQTLPQENISTRILKKLGFTFTKKVDHPEDGLVWEWELKNESVG